MSKPRVFIGSSTAALEVARNVQAHLEVVADVTVWRDLPGEKTLSKTIIEAILSIITEYDFAVMIFAADDEINRGGDPVFVPRDNVVFELGLFVAHLGRERTFIIRETGVELKVASDLNGVLTANYDGRTNNLRSVLNTPCLQIRDVIKALGPKQAKTKISSDDPVKHQFEELLNIQSLTGVIGVRRGITSDALRNLILAAKRVRILQTWTPDIVRGLEKELLSCVTENEGTVEVLLIAPGPIATQRRIDQEEDLNLEFSALQSTQ